MNRWRDFNGTLSFGRAAGRIGGNWAHGAFGPMVCCSALLVVGCNRVVDSDTVATATAAVEAGQAAQVGQAAQCDDGKREAILNILERFVPFAESFWRNTDLTEPRTGRYDAIGSGVTQPRGAGDIAYAYVTLLAARPTQEAFAGIPRAVLIDHTIQSIRHEALTNALSGKAYKKWGGGTWQASLETSSWAFAAHRLWNDLDDETRALVKKVVVGEANILVTKSLASGEEGDTGAEDNAWNCPTPALAAVMFPAEANVAVWEYATKRLAMNASSITADATDSSLVDGQPVSGWMSSVNLHPDLTMENHGYFNPIYQQVTHVDINDAAIAYAESGRSLPEAYSFRTQRIWQDVLMRLATDEGDLVMPAGQDWTSKDFQHLEYLGILATRFHRIDASVLESRALDLVAYRQAIHADGSMLGQSQIGYETMLIKRLAALWWTHELFGPSPVPTEAEFADARANAQGVRTYPYSDFIAARLGQAFVSMSWDPARPMGLVVPHSAEFSDDPLFSYYAPGSLVGQASGVVGPHNCDCRSDRFSTAGTIGARRFSMTAFPDGVTMLLDRGVGSTFTYALEDIAGVQGPRPIWSSAGDALGTLSGNWVNAADRIGMIVRGGAGLSAVKTTGTNNQIVITGSTATGSGNRGAILLPNVDHERTMALEPHAAQPNVPEDWSALVGRAADESVRLSLARWAGAEMVPVEITDDRGAPIPEQDASVANRTASFVAHLAMPASQGQTIRYFVDSVAQLRAQQRSEVAAVIRNPNEDDATASVTYAPAAGVVETRQRVLIAGEEVVARVVGGALTLAGPELESLVSAKDQLASLSAQLPEPTCEHNRDHDHGGGHHCEHHCEHGYDHQANHLSASLQEALLALDRAILESQSVDPNARRLAWAIERARWAIEVFEREPGLRSLAPELRRNLQTIVDGAEGDLRNAATQSKQVSTWVVANGLAQPGELLDLQVTVLNHGMRCVRHGSVTISGPDAWGTVGPVSAFSYLAPGASTTLTLQIPVPVSATPGDVARLTAELNFEQGRRDGTALADLDAPVDPIVDLVSLASRIPLGLRGANQVPARIANLADHAMDISLSATLPSGISLDVASQTFSLPATSSMDLMLLVRNVTNASGTGQLNLIARTAAGAEVSSVVTLSYSDDLALNTVAAPFPLASATSNQAPYPPTLAFDGNAGTFWVSGGTVAGQGPTPTQPIFLTVDFGVTELIGSVTMVPRAGYGPKAYTIEVSADATTWVQVASIPSAANGTITTTLTPVQARYLQLRMTAGWDRIQPPRNVQVSSLIVKASML